MLLAIPFLIIGAAVLLGAILAPAAGVAANVVRTVDDNLLDYPPIPEDLRELAERSEILDRDGNRLALIREENREIVTLDEVPEHVRQAVIATEDQEFYTHEGVNWRSVVRAAAGNVRAGEVTSGASTLTQQLVKNLVLENTEQTLDRKLQEAVYALELEKRMDKDAILESYLNTAYFANGVYGIGAAADFYWGKAPAELTVADAALLAGMLRSPERNEPIDHPDNALARREIVLNQMASLGFLPESDASRLAGEPLALDVQGRRGDAGDITVEGTGDYIVTYIIEQLKKDPALGSHPDEEEAKRVRFRALATGGYTIRTTINPGLQRIAQDAIRSKLSPEDDPLGALTAVDPRSGEIMAIGFGPRPFGTGPGQVDVNPAVPDLGSDYGRQSGSAFKAFEVVAALEAGTSPAYTISTPSPYRPTGHCAGAGGWAPGNYSDGGGGVMDMARATAVSSNVYFAHLVDEVTGPESLRDVAQRMGLRNTDLGGHCASVLGTDGTYPLDMAVGFGTLANGGISCEPFIITEVVDRSGRVVSRGGDRCDRAIDEGIAARATAILRGPIENGTASRNGRIGRPAAGKTGTTQGYRDAWFVGFVPQLSTAVWVGRESGDDPLTHPDCPRGMTGGCVPTSIWSTFMKEALAYLDLPVESFSAPPPMPSSSVPSVVGMSKGAAEAALTAASFRPVVEVVADHRPDGTVVGQSPGGGSSAPTGSAVRISVSDGTGEAPRVPDVVGLPRAEAAGILERLGLTVAVNEVPVDDIGLIGAVVAQRPSAGSPLESGTSVTIDVGRQRGPEDDAPEPTESPSPSPTEPTPQPPEPSEPPSPAPTPGPTAEPAPEPAPEPTVEPTPAPTGAPAEGGDG